MDIDTEAHADRNVVTMGQRGIVAECSTPIDAIRIAACVNACRGISTYSLVVGFKPMRQIAHDLEIAIERVESAHKILKAIGS